MSSSSSSSTTDLKEKLVHVINESSLQSNQKASAMLSLKDELLNDSTLEDWKAYERKENLPKLLRELFNEAAGLKEPTSTMQAEEGSHLLQLGTSSQRRWSINANISRRQHYFFVERRTFVKKLVSEIQKGLSCLLLIGPRASGKTTTVDDLKNELEDNVIVLLVDFSVVCLYADLFWKRLLEKLCDRVKCYGISTTQLINSSDLSGFFSVLKNTTPKKVILAFDEFDAIFQLEPELRDAFLIVLRNLKQQPELHNIVSIIGIGVFGLLNLNTSNIRLSPFNIKDSIRIDFFTREEAQDLFDQFQKEYGVIVDSSVIDEIFDYTAGQPGLFCLCGRIIQEALTGKSFSMDAWRALVLDGTLNDQVTSYPSGQRVLSNFQNTKGDPDFEKARTLFSELLLHGDPIDTYYRLDYITYPEVLILSSEGLIIPIDIVKRHFKITSGIIRDIFFCVMLQPNRIPLKNVYPGQLDLADLVSSAVQCFDVKGLIECYKYATKDVESPLKTITGEKGLRESTYHFELISILHHWLPSKIDMHMIVHAKTTQKRYPDIFIVSKTFRNVVELLASERFGPKDRDSSVLGHMERAKKYGEELKAEPWIIHFIGLKSITSCDNVEFPSTETIKLQNVNVIYVMHDHQFIASCMKYQKVTDIHSTMQWIVNPQNK